MNEQAIQDSYNVFVSNGYTKSIDEFKTLINNNPNALKDSYDVFVSNGYGKTIDDYKSLMGIGAQQEVKKKGSSVSNTPQPPQTGTTELPVAGGSSAMPAPTMGQSAAALFSSVGKTIYQTADDLIVSARKGLQEKGFFDDDIPDTNTPITDAIKKKASSIKTLDARYGKPQEDGGPLDITPLIKGAAEIGLKVINSTMPQDQKNVIISALNLGDSYMKRNLRQIEQVKKYALPKDNKGVKVAENILEMVPDLLTAEVIGSPAAAEGKLTKTATEMSEGAKPLIQKYLPKAAKFIEDAVRAPFTKIMAAKGVASGMANAKEGEDIVEAGLEGGIEGAKEGVIMHGLGVVAGKATPKIAKLISKTGLNSTWSTGIANPLANAGVFTTAKAIRTPIETGELATGEELAMEAGTGIGFSLLHAGSLAKNHNELNHYADNTLKTDATESLKRVVNETKDNLDLVYNPDLTAENISELEGARTELKSAILKEPDLKNKQLLINEALKIQNQLDAHSAVNNIIEHKDLLIEGINSDESVSEKNKEFYTKKITAIADHFDNSEFGLKKKELDAKINDAQKSLDDASLGFTNLKKASDRVQAKIDIDRKRAELEDLNNELTNLITNKDAVQEPTTDESVLRTKQPEVELQGVGEGNAQPEGVTAEETITNAKPKGLEPNGGVDANVDKFESYSGNKFEITLSNVDETGQPLPRGEGKKQIMVKTIDSDGTVRVNNALTKTFETAAEAKEYANKFIEKDTKVVPTEVATEEIKNKLGEPTISEIEDGKLYEFQNENGLVAGVLTSPTEFRIDGINAAEVGKGKGSEMFEDLIQYLKAIGVKTISTKSAGEGAVIMHQKAIDKGLLTEVSKNGREAVFTINENKPTKTIDVAIKTLQESKEYIEADDIQKEKLVRATRKEFGLKEKSAPSVNRLFGKLKDIAKITMTEKVALVKQIKDLARGGKDAQEAIREATQALTKEIIGLREGGKINKPQEEAILNRLGKTNVLSETSVRRYIDYVSKVYADAEYSGQLKIGRETKGKISKLSRSKDKNPHLTALGKKFINIDPSMVDDIYTYNKIAAEVQEAIKGSNARKFADTVIIDEVNKYVDEAIKTQDEKLSQERDAESEDLFGINEETKDDIKNNKEIDEEKEKELRGKIKNQFDIYANQIKEAIRTGENPFTGEDVSYSQKDKETIQKFMDMDLSLLKVKDAISASDALQNFLANESTANMDNVLGTYEGKLEAKEFNGKSIPLRKLWSKPMARFFTEGGTTMGEVFTKMFKGATAGDKFAKASGILKIIKGNSAATTKINSIAIDFIDKFYKKKANNQAFNTAYNIAERGIVSDLRRYQVGKEEYDFKRRVKILDQSIERMSEGTNEEREKAKLYQQIYDKIVKGSENAKDVESKTDKINLKAIEFWQDVHENSFDDFAKYMLNVHNTILEKGVNYSSPDKYASLSDKTNELEDITKPMYGRDGDYLYKTEAGGLKKAEFPDKLPEGRYRDYSFDQNNIKSIHDALVDMHTGAAIRQLEAFRKSDNFKKIVTTQEDRDLLNRRFELYVKNIRNGSGSVGAEDLKPLMKILDKTATIGVGLALGGPTQVGKQIVPVAINTVANAGSIDLGGPFNPHFIEFLNGTDYATGHRGVESHAQIESLNKKIEQAASGGPAKLAKVVEGATKFWIKEFLVRGDVYIAKASWKTYYEKSLKKQGIDIKNLDYKNHKINEQAGDYAEMMTTRQQNINDPNLAGSWFTTRGTERKILSKVFLNLANFKMNQASRLAADITTLGHWSVSSKEDKVIAARSLAGYALEQATYRLILGGITIGLGSLAKKMMGKDESDADKKERVNNVWKGQYSNTMTDFLSPAPPLDIAIKPILAMTTKGIEDATGVPVSTFGNTRETYANTLGGYGIAIQKGAELWDLLNLANSGTYTDDFGQEKKISEENQNTLKNVSPFATLSTLGILPSEVGIISRNIVKFSKKKEKSLSEELLSGYESQEKMKKENPSLYEKNFGKNSRWYSRLEKEREMERKLKKMKER